MSEASLPDIPVPAGWAKNVRSAVLHVISLANFAIVATRGWAANALNPHARQAAEMDRLTNEVALLREELRIKDARLAKIDPRRRPYYPSAERMAILQLKAARGWSLAQAARAFLVDAETIAAWLRRIDDDGSSAIVQLREPVNEFPDFVRHIVCRLKVLCPSLGKVKIAQILARAGLHLCATTIGRMLKAKKPTPKPTETPATQVPTDAKERVVTAKRPNHVWHVDLTVVPTGSGFWTAWLPLSLPQCWPFCWWVACVVDHFSRKVMGIAVFRKQPDSKQVSAFLAKTIRQTGARPKYIICDKGPKFWCKAFKRWCRRGRIRPRFGAVDHYGSIAVIERFFRTFKDEGLRRVLVPLNLREVRQLIIAVACWYNTHRPHSWLGGRTPDERYCRIPSACRRPGAGRPWGGPLDRCNVRARFISACGILGPERQAMLTIHCGRHSCASHLLAAGWPIPAVRDMLGHANLWTTDLYSHAVVDNDVPPDPFAFADNRAVG